MAPSLKASIHTESSSVSSIFAAPSLDPLRCEDTPSGRRNGGEFNIFNHVYVRQTVKEKLSNSSICFSSASTGPPVPPLKPLKFQHQLLPSDSHSSLLSPPELLQCKDSSSVRTERLQLSPADLRSRSPLEPNSPNCISNNTAELQPPLCSYVERLRREGDGGREGGEDDEGEAGGQRGLDRSSYHHAIAALENTSEEEEEEDNNAGRRPQEEEENRSSFQRPVVETESTFRPAEFKTRLLPPENKPLEMAVLKKSKELVLSHNHHSIAKHMLLADCQVFKPATLVHLNGQSFC